MSLRRETPCDWGECPYNAEYINTCEYYCGTDEPNDDYYGDLEEEENSDQCDEDFNNGQELQIWN